MAKVVCPGLGSTHEPIVRRYCARLTPLGRKAPLWGPGFERKWRDMGSQAASLLYLVVMVTVVVVVDWRFLRRHLWLRLAVNVGIVLVFLAVYWLFVRRQ